MTNEDIRQENIQTALRHAVRLFAEEGIEDATFKKLAQRCKLTMRSLFRYFGTKEVLIRETFTLCLRKVKGRVLRIRKVNGFEMLSGKEQVVAILRGILVEVQRDSRTFCCIYAIEDSVARSAGEDALALFWDHNSAVADCFRDAFAKGIKDGTIDSRFTNELEYQTLSIFFRGFVKHIAMLCANKNMRDAHDIEGIIEIFLKNMKFSIEPRKI